MSSWETTYHSSNIIAPFFYAPLNLDIACFLRRVVRLSSEVPQKFRPIVYVKDAQELRLHPGHNTQTLPSSKRVDPAARSPFPEELPFGSSLYYHFPPYLPHALASPTTLIISSSLCLRLNEKGPNPSSSGILFSRRRCTRSIYCVLHSPLLNLSGQSRQLVKQRPFVGTLRELLEKR